MAKAPLTKNIYPAIPRRDPLMSVEAITEVADILTGATGNGLDKAITYRDLNNLGFVDFDFNPRSGKLINARPVTPDPVNYGIPPIPENVVADGSFRAISISWDSPDYGNHAYAEIHRSSDDNLANAILIGTSRGVSYSDRVGSSESYYYWVRFVNQGNIAGAFNATAGTLATTYDDPAFIIGELTDRITESQLALDLSSRIDLIDATDTGLVTIYNNLNTQINDASTGIATLLGNLDDQINNASTGLAKSYETIEANFDILNDIVTDPLNGHGTKITSLENLTDKYAVRLNVLEASTQPLLGDWSGNVNIPASANMASGYDIFITSSHTGGGTIRIRLSNATQGFNIALNDVEVADNYIGVSDDPTWYNFEVSNIIDGSNKITLWSEDADQPTVTNVELRSGAGGYESRIADLETVTGNQATRLNSLGTWDDTNGYFTEINQLQQTSVDHATIFTNMGVSKTDTFSRTYEQLIDLTEDNSQIYTVLGVTKDDSFSTNYGQLISLTNDNAQIYNVLGVTKNSNFSSTYADIVRVSGEHASMFTSLGVNKNDTFSTNYQGLIDLAQDNAKIYNVLGIASNDTFSNTYRELISLTNDHATIFQNLQISELDTFSTSYSQLVDLSSDTATIFTNLGLTTGSQLPSGYSSLTQLASTHAQQIETLQQGLGAVQQASTITEDEANNIRAQYTVKTDANGVIAGIGVVSDSSTGTGSVYIRADEFAILPSGSTNTSDSALLPFTVTNNRVYINEASIVNLRANNINGGELVIDALTVTTDELVFQAGSVHESFLREDFVNTLVRVDPNAEVLGGTRSKRTSAINGTHYISTSSDPFKSSGGVLDVQLRIYGGTDYANRVTSSPHGLTAPSIDITIYRKNLNTNAVETVVAYTRHTGSLVIEAEGNKFFYAYTLINKNLSFRPSLGSKSVPYEYYFTLANRSGSWGDNHFVSVSITEPTTSSGGVLVDWGGLINVPTEFKPESHTHIASEITDLMPLLNQKADVHSHPYAPSTHNHDDLYVKVGDPIGNADTVDGKHASDFAMTDHTGHSSYPRLFSTKAGGTTWLRAPSTSGGFLPHRSGDSDSYLGTNSWRWYGVYANTVNAYKVYGTTLYENGTSLSSKYLGINGTAQKANAIGSLTESQLARINTTTPTWGYGYFRRDHTSPALYVNQRGTGDIARFMKGESDNDTSSSANQVTFKNNGDVYTTGSFFSYDGDFVTQSSTMRIGGSGQANIYIRPYGYNSSTNQAVLYTTGEFRAKTVRLTSAIRYKNIERIIPTSESLSLVSSIGELGAKVGYWKSDLEQTQLNRWLIAEEVNEVAPELVTKNDNGECESVDYQALVPDLCASIAELKKEIAQLKEQLANG